MTKRNLFSIFMLVIFVGALGFFAYQNNKTETAFEQQQQMSSSASEMLETDATAEDMQDTTEEAATEIEAAAGDTTEEVAPSPLADSSQEKVNTETSTTVKSETSTFLSPRTLGTPDAPIKVEEFASLSCSHCANFHKTTFQTLKTDYIETGKVFFVYNDFPLNASALEASMLARCLPEQHYFKFIGFLFENQDKWAFEPDYREKLIQNAKLLGQTEESAKACIENQSHKQDLIAKVQKASEEHNISSTPSFLLNGQPVLVTELLKEIDKKLNTKD